MEINIRLGKNFTTQYNKLQAEFGTELARINGFDDGQLSYTDFIDEFIDKQTVADASIDGNSNVSHKDIVTLLSEMPKPHQKLLGFNKIYYEFQKKYGFKAANEWLRMEWMGQLYLHDGNTATFKHYCFAYDLKDLAEKGLYFLGNNFNAKPPKHLITFVDFVKEFIGYASNRSSGAVGLPNLLPYMYYFWKKDVDNHYLGIGRDAASSAENYAKQNFQRFIYAVNQPYVRDGQQSAFTNTSVFDRPYFEALFGGSEFPDGTFMIDYEDEIIEFQKWYMEVMAEVRSENMFTFPVSTISLLRKEGEYDLTKASNEEVTSAFKEMKPDDEVFVTKNKPIVVEETEVMNGDPAVLTPIEEEVEIEEAPKEEKPKITKRISKMFTYLWNGQMIDF